MDHKSFSIFYWQKNEATWLCGEGDRERVEVLLVGLRGQGGDVRGFRLQVPQTHTVGACGLGDSLVLTTTNTRTSSGSTSAATSRRNLTDPDFIVSTQTRQNRAPLQSGRIRGNIPDLDALGAENLCRKQCKETKIMLMCALNFYYKKNTRLNIRKKDVWGSGKVPDRQTQLLNKLCTQLEIYRNAWKNELQNGFNEWFSRLPRIHAVLLT